MPRMTMKYIFDLTLHCTRPGIQVMPAQSVTPPLFNSRSKEGQQWGGDGNIQGLCPV